jgi:hypothetical protein
VGSGGEGGKDSTMSEEEIGWIIRGTQTVFGLYGLLYIATAVMAPAWFLDTLAVNDIAARHARKSSIRNVMSPGEPWWTLPVTLLTLIAIGVVLYGALAPAVSVIPRSWGGATEDGDWTSTRNYIQFGGAIIGSLAVAMRLEKNAETLVWAPLERQARFALVDTIAATRRSNPSIAERAKDKIEAVLLADTALPSSSERDWRESIHRAVINGMWR